MALLELTSAVSMFTGKMKIGKKRPKPTLAEVLTSHQPKLQPRPKIQMPMLNGELLPAQMRDGRLERFFDEAYDRYIRSDAKREESLRAISAPGARNEISHAEKEANQEMVIACGAFGLATVGTLISPALLLGTISGLVFLSWKRYRALYDALFKQRRVTMDLIDGICVIAIFSGGLFITGSFAFFLSALSRKILAKTKENSHKRLINIFGEQPKSVWVLVDGTEIEALLEELQRGDIVVVYAGQAIPIDGTIVDGIGSVDQRFLTGEAQPVEKSIDDKVFAATTVLSGRICIVAETAGKDTYVAQIGEILNQTADLKLALQSKGEVFADKTVLPTIALSGLVLPILGINGALAIIWSSFGWSLRVTVPMSLMNFLTILSRDSVLVKDARSLEVLNKVNTVVFDKTGTLTLEQPRVGEIYTCDKFSTDELLRYAAIAEAKQTHPIAKAIQTEALARDIDVQAVDDVHYEIGYGIRVNLGKRVIRVGSERFMRMEEIAVPAEIQALQTQCNEQGHSLVMVSVGDKLAGAIELHASIRPEAKSIVQELQQRNLATFIISGDHEQPTKKLAEELGIDGYFANTLPTDKAKLVEELQSSGNTVCFIGDGINDSIALEKADVSISLRGATTVATDMAQIVLMDGNLEKLVFLFDTANELDVNMNNNLVMSVIPGIICLGGAFFLHFGFAAATITTFLGLLGGISNTLKPLRKHQLS